MSEEGKEYLGPVGEGIFAANTGDWRTQYPEIDQTACSRCGTCLLYCPTNSVRRVEGRFEINLDYCKGCAICSVECPKRCIAMKRESRK